MQDQAMDSFTLGFPKIVCRWRVFNRCVPMENRHIRALGARQLNGSKLSPALVGWAKQHLEWTLKDGALTHPNGVLMLLVDEEGRAAMSMGPYEPLAKTSFNHLVDRANNSFREAKTTGVSPEDLWVVQGSTLIWGSPYDYAASGSSSLVVDLARTLGMVVQRDGNLLHSLRVSRSGVDEAFLVSDEHGVVPASDMGGRHAEKFAAGYKKLLESMKVK